MEAPAKHRDWGRLALALWSTAAFTVVGWASARDGHHALFWPAAGLAVLLLRRPSLATLGAVAGGAALGGWASQAWLGAPPLLELAEALGDVAGGLAGSGFAHRFRLLEQAPARRAVLGWTLALLAALVGTAASSAPHLWLDPSGPFPDLLLRFLARLTGVALVSPLALGDLRRALATPASRREAAVLGAALVGVSAAAFWAPAGGPREVLTLFALLPLVATGLRLSTPAPQVGVLVVAALAVVAQRGGHGLFGPEGMEVPFQLFLLLTVLATHLVSASMREREAAHAALAQSEERFRLMSDDGRDLVCLHSPAGELLSVSASASAILGRPAEELVGRFLHGFVHAGDVVAVEERLGRALAGSPEVLRFRVRRGDGTWTWLEMTARRTVDARGRPLVLSASRDINEQMWNLERLRLACQSAGIAAFTWDPVRHTLEDEGRFTELYGVDVARARDPLRAWLECIHPDDRTQAELDFKEALRSNQAHRSRFRVLHPRHGERHIFAVVEVERNVAGQAVRLTGLHWDVTDQVRVEGQLREARDVAERATAAKASFLAMMSHEIRTPLNGIIGMTDALLPEVSAANRHAVDTIRRSGEVLLKVLNDILDFSKIEAGKLELEHQPCDLRQVLGDLGSLYAGQAREKGLALEVQVPHAVERLVCDPLRLRQVLGNLVSNAVKFTPRGQVTVRCQPQAPAGDFPRGAVRLEVADTGVGIPADKLPRLFQEFTQADASTTRRFGGTGLGLAISRRLVEGMGGTLTVASEPERGSTFTVTLPLPQAAELAAADATAQAEGAGPPLEAGALKGLRLLLAEDNAINRKVATALLAKLGVTVETVENGRQALEAWARGGWDAVVMDVQMPELDGLEAARAIRSEEAAQGLQAVPILAMTANAFAEDRRACLDAGMDEVVTKPTTQAALQAALTRVMARPRRVPRRVSA